MKTVSTFILWTVTASAGMFLQLPPTPLPKPISAPTYYIAVEARTCEPHLIQFNGASNIPPEALIGLTVSDFDQDGWKDYSDEVYVAVNEKGFFNGKVEPKKGVAFRRNLILVGTFAPYRPQQPAGILRIVGKKGERLGGFENPQLFQVSGWNYGLQTIARVPAC